MKNKESLNQESEFDQKIREYLTENLDIRLKTEVEPFANTDGSSSKTLTVELFLKDKKIAEDTTYDY